MIIPLGLLFLYFGVIILIGFFNRKNKNKEEFFLASKKLPSWLLAITFIASWWGGGSAIDVVDHAYANGINSFWIYGMPVLISTFFMFVFAKAIRRLSTISQPQIMEKRYNSQIALLLSVLIVVFMLVTAASQIVAIAKFFQVYLDVDYSLAAIVGTLLVLIYSLFGGFKAVVITDLFQFVFFLITAIVVFVICYNNSGGFDMAMQKAELNNKIGYMSFFYDIGNNLTYVITFGAAWMIQANVWQRISAANRPVDARKMMGLSFFAFIPLYLLVSLTGILSYSFIDHIPEGGIVAYIIKNYSSPILAAVLFVGLCSAIMSTLDSLINTGSLSLTIDIYSKYINPKASTSRLVLVGRIATLLIGFVALLIALEIRSLLKLSWIASDLITTTVFAPLILGFVWKRASVKACFVSIIFGFCFSTYNLLVFLGIDLPVAWEHQSTTQAVIGIIGSTLIFVISSFLLTDDNKTKAELFVQDSGLISN